MVFWHEKGLTLWRTIEAYMRRRLDAAGYVEVRTPQVLDRKFWESPATGTSTAQHVRLRDGRRETLSLKPMNCPGHVQIFKFGQKSYRDLPLRMAEFGACHRYEPSGALHGLMRVRAFTQDDAHIFCREDQIEEETAAFIKLPRRSTPTSAWRRDHIIALARARRMRAGTDEFWDKAEAQMLNAARAAGVEPVVAEGDGAFYAPKLDFQ
jgi:threonyl-tRNA synthetase